MKMKHMVLIAVYLGIFMGCQQNEIHSSQQMETVWQTKMQMTLKRAFHSAAVADGKVYVFGGATGGSSEFTGTPSVEMFDPVMNQWLTKADMPESLILSCAVTIKDKIYVLGGEKGAQFEKANDLFVYDYIQDSWVKKASMNIARSFHCAVTLNNKIYAIGGRENNNEIRTKSRDSLAVYTIEEYDVEADKWTIKSVMPFKHFTIGAVTLNNKIYILSDTTNNSMMGESANLEEYDPASNRFTVKSDLKPSKCDAAVSVCNNKIYIFGGWRSGALSSVEVYDPEKNNWKELEGMPYIVQNHQAVTIDNKIFISGGINYISRGVNEKKDILLLYKPDGDVSKENDKKAPAKGFSLLQNYPNPFNSTTKIPFNILENGLVTIKVFNVLGKEVATILNKEINAGSFEIEFNTSSIFKGLQSCVYFYKLEMADRSSTKKMILLQ